MYRARAKSNFNWGSREYKAGDPLRWALGDDEVREWDTAEQAQLALSKYILPEDPWRGWWEVVEVGEFDGAHFDLGK